MKKRILVVEDDQYLQQAYKAFFSTLDYECSYASDGEEATALLKTHEYDLILLDLVMPNKTGIQFLHELRKAEQQKHVPVIIATNMNAGNEREVCMEYGISDFCIKTDTPVETMIEKVRIALQE